MKLKEIVRTATFAWSPSAVPTLATGTVAGALDASFSNDAHLEIWTPDLQDGNHTLGAEGGSGPSGIVTTSARFNRLAWGYINPDRPEGVIAAGLESGQLELWDPAQITHETDISSARLLQNSTHTGPVRALHFNPLQHSLLASGGTGSELYIWDLKNPATPYTPGARSQRLDGVSSLAWNAQVAHILASSSPSGYTVVWDLRGKREVVALQYGGAGGPAGGGPGGGAGALGAAGLRRGMSDVAWHPDNATRLITSSEDDSSPVIMLWDLRNARAPEKILTGHERGVLSLSWSTWDPDLLLSCGKDNRTLCWNPTSGEIVGQLPPSANWSFQTSWNPRNPGLFATANYDGTIAVHSIQSTSSTSSAPTPTKAPANPNDVFDPANFADTNDAQNLGASLSLEKAPKWLKPPVGARFGFGGRLVEVHNTTGEEEKKERKVLIKRVVGEEGVIKRAKELIEAEKSDGGMKTFVEERVKAASESASTDEKELTATDKPSTADKQGWSALLALFDADPKDSLVKLVGYDTSPAAMDEALAAVRAKTYEPVVSFAAEAVHVPHSPVGEEEPEGVQEGEAEEGDGEDSEAGTDVPGAAPSEVSAFSSDAKHVDAASTATEPSLFGDDPVGGGATGPAAGDFFNTLASSEHDASTIRPRAGLVPHLSYTGESSAAATIGSRASSVAGDIPTTPSIAPKSFRLHPKKEDATSAMVTRALITGNLDTAVELCVQAGRWADALLLAQGEGLVMRTRMAYFEKQQQQEGGYLRVFKGVVQGRKGLTELVRAADVNEWREVMVVLCRWAEAEAFAQLVGELGERVPAGGAYGAPAAGGPYGVPATTGPYGAPAHTGAYGAPAAATGPYGAPTGPSGHYSMPSTSSRFGAPPAPANTGPYGAPPAPSTTGPYGAPPPSGPYAPPPSTNSSGPNPPGQPYGAPSNNYGPQGGYGGQQGGYAPPGQQGGYNPPGQQTPYGPPGQQGGYQSQQPGYHAPMVSVPPPPPPASAPTAPPVIPASQRRDIPGWNDAPNVTVPQRRTPAPAGPPAAAITSPFPNSPAPASPVTYGDKTFLPPPPRGSGTPQRTMSPQVGQGPPPSQGPPRSFGAPPPRPQSGGSYAPPPSQQASAFAPPPPAGGYAPPTQTGAPPPSGPYGPPPGQQNAPPPPPPTSGAYAPPPGQQHPPPPPAAGGQGANLTPQGGPPPPPPGGPGAARSGTPTAPPAKAAPKAPKYPAGDREHIPASDRVIFEVLSEHLARLRQNTPPQQKRMVDDIERRLNVLFDALNCETLSRPVVDQLLTLIQAMQVPDGPGATAIHVDLLTRGSRTDDIGLWMSGVKQLIIRM
ncbi:protein transport protein S31 [Ceratobasidium sp. 392]|nr:protein transport protein S31 [Ceratobasidium sp. 392]